MKLGLGSKTKILTISPHSDEINTSDEVHTSVLCPTKKNLCSGAVSVPHHPSLRGAFTIVSDALGRLTEQHEWEEETTNIY